jgi:hypothetical protein
LSIGLKENQILNYVFQSDISIVLIFFYQEPSSFGSLLELCWKGTKTVPLEAGGERKFLQVMPPPLSTGR